MFKVLRDRNWFDGVWVGGFLLGAGMLLPVSTVEAATVQVDYKFNDPSSIGRDHSAFLFTVGGRGEYLLTFDIDQTDNGAWLFYEEGSRTGTLSYNVRATNGRLTNKETGETIASGENGESAFRIWTDAFVVEANDGAFDSDSDAFNFFSSQAFAGLTESANVQILLENTAPDGTFWEGLDLNGQKIFRQFASRATDYGASFVATQELFSQWPGLEYGFGDTHWVPTVVGRQRHDNNAEVPEPATLLLLGSGVAALRLRKRKS